jgi:hypothetical protein
MFARLTAKAILAAAAIAMAFFGIGLLGMALAHALVQALGVAGGYALAGAILLVPPLIWVVAGMIARPRKPPPPPPAVACRRWNWPGQRHQHVSQPQHGFQIAAFSVPGLWIGGNPSSDLDVFVT